MKKTILLLSIIIFTSCQGNAQTDSAKDSKNDINPTWYGEYSLFIEYGKIDKAGIFIGYNITITKDSCKFWGMGYQTSFEYICEPIAKNKKLYLSHVKTVKQLIEHTPSDTLAILYKRNNTYYIKSSSIANKEGQLNRFIEIEKSE